MFLDKLSPWWHMMSEEGGGDSGSVASESGDTASASVDGGDAGGVDNDSGDTATTPSWSENWRQDFAGGDEDVAKRLGRYASPREATKALIAAQNRIRSGELKSSLSDNPSEEELATWRQENGIPESPDKYDLKFDDGLVIGEEDQPIIDSFLQAAHEKNMPPDQAKHLVKWWYDNQQQQAEARMAQDVSQRDATMDELNADWGGEFRGNINRVESLLTQFPEEARESIREARLPDGTYLFNNPDILRGLVNISYESDPAGAIVPAGVGDPMKNIDGRIDEINTYMRQNRTEYFKNEKMQQELRDLLAAQEKLKSRTG
jgi:hypothetical protein